MADDQLRRWRRAQRSTDEETFAGPAITFYPTRPPTALGSPQSMPRPTFIRPIYDHGRLSNPTVPVPTGAVIHLPHRIAGPHAAKLPIDNAFITTDIVTNQNDLIIHLVEMADGLNIALDELVIIRRKHVEDDDIFSAIHDTVLFVAKTTDGRNDPWVRLFNEARAYLKSMGLEYLNVEITHMDGQKLDMFFSVEGTHPLASSWGPGGYIADEILNILGDRQWIGVEPFRRGIHPIASENPVTIVVTIDEDSTDDWNSPRDAMVQLLDSNGHQDVAVFFGRDSVEF